MQNNDSFTVVLPVFNEQDNLDALFREIRNAAESTGKKWQALFVDDCSSDGSLDVIKRIADDNPETARYVTFAENRGQSAAFCAGFDTAETPVVITMDADGQNDPADIPAMLDEFCRGYDMVVGWRANRKDTLSKRIASKLANKVRDAFTADGVRDTGCSLKVMRREILLKLPRFRNMHRFLPALMRLQGARISEVKVNHRPRITGVSKYSNWERGVQGIYDLIGVRWLMSRNLEYSIRERR
ncbi:glycosyltransferase family 2 protein [Desulfovibrio oxyclinae]|uniref:glycosyltransferase family 2 protein n=1 Tax=Desulfovibrio oxyclinae TaxID=63560 RepID=UPI00037ED49F|nr:glycosyltransferase family 2 protein [Desulfovibrio oxyclinae]